MHRKFNVAEEIEMHLNNYELAVVSGRNSDSKLYLESARRLLDLWERNASLKQDLTPLRRRHDRLSQAYQRCIFKQ